MYIIVYRDMNIYMWGGMYVHMSVSIHLDIDIDI